jgi:hypothetical protein
MAWIDPSTIPPVPVLGERPAVQHEGAAGAHVDGDESRVLPNRDRSDPLIGMMEDEQRDKSGDCRARQAERE